MSKLLSPRYLVDCGGLGRRFISLRRATIFALEQGIESVTDLIEGRRIPAQRP